MCEFTVFLNNKIVYRDVVYAKTEGNIVLLKTVLGSTKKMEKCRISEVDVSSDRLVLVKNEASAQ